MAENKYQRKYDHDLSNPMRACETLCFHSKNDSQYIAELTKALQETGLIDDTMVDIEYRLKEDFIKTDYYETGKVYANDRIEAAEQNRKRLQDEIQNVTLKATVDSYQHKLGLAFEQDHPDHVVADTTAYSLKTLPIKEIDYPVVRKALQKFPCFRFDKLKEKLPELKSLHQFVTEGEYLGNKIITIRTSEGTVMTNRLRFLACFQAFRVLAEKIEKVETQYVGTREFRSYSVRKTFTNKRVRVAKDKMPKDFGYAHWFVYDQFVGTLEEERFLDYFAGMQETLREKEIEPYLIRNERQLKIYDFEEGRGFEPDFVLILRKKGEELMYQIFIEPKGKHIFQYDAWKESFLSSINDSEKIVLLDGSENRLIGLPMYNQESTEQREKFDQEFRKYLAEITDSQDDWSPSDERQMGKGRTTATR